MSLGISPRQPGMFATTTSFCEQRVAADSIYGLLHRECFELFPDEMFADLEVCPSQSHRSGSELVHIGGAPAVGFGFL